jgi:hypothetical protein
MSTFLASMMNAGTAAGQTRPEGGADAALGPARPIGLGTTIATSTIGSS